MRVKIPFAILALIGLTGVSSAQTNNVLSLNGTSACVSISSSSALQPASEITVEAWLFPTTTKTPGWFIAKSDGQSGASQRTYELKLVPSGIDFAVYFSLPVGANQPDFAEIIAPILENAWTHVAATYSTANGLAIYTNGSLAAFSTKYSGQSFLGLTVRQTALPLNFGGSTYPGLAVFTGGYMDEIRIWNVARTDVQIGENRFCRLTGAENNLAGYWNFDSGNAIDITGNGNNGTLLGGAVIGPILGADTVHEGVCGAPYLDKSSLSFSQVFGFHQSVIGPANMTVQIESSTNFSAWTPILVLPHFSGQLEFDDPTALAQPYQFYRVIPK